MTDSTEIKTPLQFARKVKKTIDELETKSGGVISKDTKRLTLRHEAAHALGHDQDLVNNFEVLSELSDFDEDGWAHGFRVGTSTSLKDVGDRTARSRINSAMAPLKDRRYQQKLSQSDIDEINSAQASIKNEDNQ